MLEQKAYWLGYKAAEPYLAAKPGTSLLSRREAHAKGLEKLKFLISGLNDSDAFFMHREFERGFRDREHGGPGKSGI